MNTHDKIELPPLPSPFGIVDPDGTEGMMQYTTKDLQDYAKAYALSAIEADRKRRGEPVCLRDAWLEYGRRSGLLNAEGMVIDPARAQTAWNAFEYACVCLGQAPQPAEAAKHIGSVHHEDGQVYATLHVRRATDAGALPDGARLYAAQQPAETDPTLPYEHALAGLIDKIVPGLDSGDILSDARTASATLTAEPMKVQSDVRVDHTPPYGNCSFRLCDLPGQCRNEGKCHHPVGGRYPIEPVKVPSDALAELDVVISRQQEFRDSVDHFSDDPELDEAEYDAVLKHLRAYRSLLARYGQPAQPAVNGYVCTVPDECETLHWRGQILSMNELSSVAQYAASAEQEKRWPFVESPSTFAYRLSAALNLFNGNALSAVRHVLIENPATIAAPVAAQPAAPYSLDHDPAGIRALTADAITGAMAYGAQGVNRPPEGHWLMQFWEIARAERESADKDAERYRKFVGAGLPITYLGEDYRDKDSLDAAIDATPTLVGTQPQGTSNA